MTAPGSQVSLRSLIYAVLIIIGLLILTGVIGWQKEDYACINGKKLSFGNRVELISIGSFKVRPYAIKYGCGQSERYNPASIEQCKQDDYCKAILKP